MSYRDLFELFNRLSIQQGYDEVTESEFKEWIKDKILEVFE